MFKNISWHSFITAIVVLVIVYYIIVGVLYFKGDVLRLLKEGIKRKSPNQPEPFSADSGSKSDSVLFSSVHELMAEFNNLFITASSQGYPKEELVTALQFKLKAYTHLKGTNFEDAIDSHIIQTSSSMCSIKLDENDMKRIW